MSELEHDLAERRIREAIERGDFDDLPGAGRPLDLRGAGDPDWWLRRKLEDEQLDRDGLDAPSLAPGALGLRRERERLPARLARIRDDDEARAVIEDYNRRVREDRLRPTPGLPAGIIAPIADVESLLADRRAARG